MDLSRLELILANQPKYRLKQAKEAVFKNLAANWSETTNLPPKLIKELNKKCPLQINGRIIQSAGHDTAKAIIILADGLKIESVLMPHQRKRFTVCVSSQVGCPLGCKFCATGASGFRRNLTAMEIVEQVLFFARHLKKTSAEKITNVVYMGMGEPFLNYDNVLASIKILNDKDGLNIGARKISVSTSGLIEGIKKLAEENLQVNLAISLHSPETDLRSALMPVNRKYPLKNVLTAADDYIRKTSRKVMFEYILLKGVNDTPAHAEKLAKLMQKPLYFVNLILYNPAGRQGLEPSTAKDVKKFKEILERAGVPVSERYRFGREIKAACGQLAANC
ncbi:MAG: 23S rRNA (adenine(2503)-C(2))-methyltransferase RlmN [Candidatus Niyogibacteria bacterium]|nr:23S rRNA (adenine(2503)-C(2))-methyltransferase RlmN [Candidatus Niyogibacteria bacterium]